MQKFTSNSNLQGQYQFQFKNNLFRKKLKKSINDLFSIISQVETDSKGRYVEVDLPGEDQSCQLRMNESKYIFHYIVPVDNLDKIVVGLARKHSKMNNKMWALPQEMDYSYLIDRIRSIKAQ